MRFWIQHRSCFASPLQFESASLSASYLYAIHIISGSFSLSLISALLDTLVALKELVALVLRWFQMMKLILNGQAKV